MASERVQQHVNRLLDEIDEAMAQLDWEQVLELSHAVLDLSPENVDAQQFLAAAERNIARSGTAASPAMGSVAIPTVVDAVTPTPTSFANDRYQVKRFLGEGGKKKVFLAHDTTSVTM